VHATPYLRVDTRGGVDGRRSNAIGTDAQLVPNGTLAQRFGAMWLRGSFEYDRHVADRWSAALAKVIGKWRVDAGAYGGGFRGGTTFTLALVPQLARLQASTAFTSEPAKGSARTVQRLRGSVSYDAQSADLLLSAEPALRRGGVSGAVFVDANGNGVRDPAEQAVEGARIIVGNQAVRSDASGRYASWGHAAHAVINVDVDTLSLSSPWWVPVRGTSRARLVSGALSTVDVPVVVGSVLSGQIVSSDSVAVGAADRELTLTLVHVGSGTSQRVAPFSDGTFYVAGLPPGEYRVFVYANAAAAADPIPVALGGNGQEGSVAFVVIKLRR
jgi:hypothetical protein